LSKKKKLSISVYPDLSLADAGSSAKKLVKFSLEVATRAKRRKLKKLLRRLM
jgi:hypothetical protein